VKAGCRGENCPTIATVAIQIQLWAFGYDPAQIDGCEGCRTIAVVAADAQDRGIMLNYASVTVVARLHAEAHIR
jgi:hypothetical protein